MTDYSDALEFAQSVAIEAGDIGKRYFSLTSDIENKIDNSPVTKADTEINTLVIERCSAKYPNVGVLGEEESREAGDKESLWVCDPIDGTFPFTLGMPISTFCLALVENGEPVLGVVYDFLNDRSYSAIKGRGAWLNGERLSVSTAEPMKLIDFEWWHTAPHDINSARSRLYAEHYQILNFASASYMSIMVGVGRVHGVVYGGDKAWDVAAAKVIVEELGCTVTDLSGQNQRYDGKIKGAIVAINKYHSDLVSIIDFNQ